MKNKIINTTVFIPYELMVKKRTEEILKKKQDLLNADNFNTFYIREDKDGSTDLIIVEMQDAEDINYKYLCVDQFSFSCNYRITKKEDFAEYIAAFNYIPLTIKEGNKIIERTIVEISDYLYIGE